MSEKDITRNYHKGNPQSQAAHGRAQASAESIRRKIVEVVSAAGPTGRTCDELEVALGLPHQTCSARCSELKRDGELVPSGKTRKTRTGSSAAILVVAPPPVANWDKAEQQELFG